MSKYSAFLTHYDVKTKIDKEFISESECKKCYIIKKTNN